MDFTGAPTPLAMKQGSNQHFHKTMSCHYTGKTSGQHNYTVAYLQVSQMYPDIRQKFLTNLSSKKVGSTYNYPKTYFGQYFAQN